jgi:uncharacterized protein (TIGR02301 family)
VLKRRACSAVFALVLCATPSCGNAAERGRKVDKPPVTLPAPSARPGPAPPPETKAYDPQLMRLAEILGALSYLRNLCGQNDADVWRGRMEALLDAEGSPAVRKEKLAGAYNRGVEGYRFAYRTCTPNARLVIQRFLDEGQRIAKEVENRYHAT